MCSHWSHSSYGSRAIGSLRINATLIATVHAMTGHTPLPERSHAIPGMRTSVVNDSSDVHGATCVSTSRWIASANHASWAATGSLTPAPVSNLYTTVSATGVAVHCTEFWHCSDSGSRKKWPMRASSVRVRSAACSVCCSMCCVFRDRGVLCKLQRPCVVPAWCFAVFVLMAL